MDTKRTAQCKSASCQRVPHTLAPTVRRRPIDDPSALALALRDDGWVLRHEVIWDKGWVRPKSARDRVTRTHDTVYMFTKGKPYFYDQDALRRGASQLRSSGTCGLQQSDGTKFWLGVANQ